MVITRSYWLGLGSGLILSALLVMIFTPYQTQKQDTMPKVQSSVPANKQDTPTNRQTASVIKDASYERDFIVPDGASAGQIAGLLVSQGFIKDKASFLATAQQMGVESKFSSGKFTLALGLTTEEMINRLTKR